MNFVKEARVELGLTQQQLADLLGVNRSTVGDWEGRRDIQPGDRNRAKIERLLKQHRAALTSSDVQKSAYPGWLNEMRGRAEEVQALMAFALERQRLLTASIGAAGAGDARVANLFASMKRDSERLLGDNDDPMQSSGGP